MFNSLTVIENMRFPFQHWTATVQHWTAQQLQHLIRYTILDVTQL